MEESLALALEHGFHDHAARAYTNFAEYAVVFKDFALAERLLAEGIAFATRHDLDSAAQYLLGRQAQLRMEQGRFREAETIADGVMNLERLPLVMHLPALTVLGRVRVRLGDPSGPALLEQALREGLATGEPQRILPVRLAHGGGRVAGRGRRAPATSSWRPWRRWASTTSIPGISASWRPGGSAARWRAAADAEDADPVAAGRRAARRSGRRPRTNGRAWACPMRRRSR